VIWIVAGLSAVIDNVPITIALIPVIRGLGEASIDITSVWRALAFGAGVGGIGTVIGSTANIIVATLAERRPTSITSSSWNRRSLPGMLATCVIAGGL
jgi:Na+/H+ antiporter NhaD/arsenite permease-like protein